MHAPMQSSPSLPRGLQVPSSFGARRSISHDLARFSLDLAPERRPVHKVPYPSPPMSHSPPPLNPQPSDDQPLYQQLQHRNSNSSSYYPPLHAAQAQPNYASYRYPQQQLQQHHQSQQQHGRNHTHHLQQPQQQQQQQQNPHQHQHQHQHPRPPQPTPFSVGASSPREPESCPAPFPSIIGEQFSSFVLPPSGRSPFVPQTNYSAPPPPRRPKSHVASACVNCKKAHLACDTRRPCPRCVGLGKQETCIDVQHKKRGRPRLRDDNRAHSFEVAQMQRPGVYSSPSSPSIQVPARNGMHKILKSQPGRRQSLQEDILGRASNYSDQRRLSKFNLPPISDATAYLTTDLFVVKSTENMRELLGYSAAELDGHKSLFDIVLDTDRAKVDHLATRINEEIRERRNPQEWLTGHQLHARIQTVSEGEVAAATRGTSTLSETLHLRRPEGNFIRIRIRAQAAVASVAFVVMAFSLANEMPPPLQLNHSASYSSLGSLRTPTPSTTPSLHSPSFLTSGHLLQMQGGPFGPQSPYSHAAMLSTSPVESRPRTMQHEPPYPPPGQYPNPSQSPVSSNFYRPPVSPAALTPMGPVSGPHTSGLQQDDLQLPPLKLNSVPQYGNARRTSIAPPEEPRQIEMPKRERIRVHEMLR